MQDYKEFAMKELCGFLNLDDDAEEFAEPATVQELTVSENVDYPEEWRICYTNLTAA